MESEGNSKAIEKKQKWDYQRRNLILLAVLTDLAPIIKDYPGLVDYSLFGVSASILLGVHKNDQRHKDGYYDKIEIQQLYEQFIKNYNKLNKEFGLNDPIEILTMYNYLRVNGYLSNNKKFVRDGRYPCKNNKFFLGPEVLTGTGSSIHTSSMLTDIFNDLNIEAGALMVFKIKHSIRDSIVDAKKYEKDNCISRELKSLKEFEKEMQIKSTDGITFAYKDGKSYYLDPHSNQIYRNRAGVLINSTDIADPRYIQSAFYNDLENFLNMEKRIQENHPSVSVSEDFQKRKETLKLCQSNMDVFEDFYQDNKDLIGETSHKILTLKRSRGIN